MVTYDICKDPRVVELAVITQNMDPFNPEQMKRYEQNLRGVQIQWQIENCPSCFHVDTQTGMFKESGNPLNGFNPQDCKDHMTDIMGQCENYNLR